MIRTETCNNIDTIVKSPDMIHAFFADFIEHESNCEENIEVYLTSYANYMMELQGFHVEAMQESINIGSVTSDFVAKYCKTYESLVKVFTIGLIFGRARFDQDFEDQFISQPIKVKKLTRKKKKKEEDD